MALLELVAIIAAFIVGYLVGKGRVGTVLGSMRTLGAAPSVSMIIANNSYSNATTATVRYIPQSNDPSTVEFDGTVKKGGTKVVKFSIPKNANSMVELNAGLGLGVTVGVQVGDTKKVYNLAAGASKSFVITTNTNGTVTSWS